MTISYTMTTPPENTAGVKVNGKWNGMIGQLFREVSSNYNSVIAGKDLI